MSTVSSDVLQILIAEDSPTQSMLLEGILRRQGFRVTAASNGRLAVEALRSFRPDLIVTDIQMPEMDGYELCRHVKTDEGLRSIPVILLTSLSAPQDIIQGLACGADNFVVKPYDEGFLLSRIDTILANRDLAEDDRNLGGINIQFAGERYVITADRRQILNLLLSTYETAVQTNDALTKAHQELKAAQEQLIEAEKLQSVGRLAAGVAHEVRNPLAILEMGMSFLADAPIGEDGKMILDEMKEAVKRTNVVISSLMDLSAPREAGVRQASIGEVIERALAELSEEITRGAVEVRREFARDLPAANADPAKLEQAFENVLKNAVDAVPDGGVVTVRTGAKTLSAADVSFDPGERGGAKFRENESVLLVQVHDTGSGIPAENLGKVFEPFFTTKPTGKGMGLGLTVAKKVIDTHGGRITVANDPAGGTLVTIFLKAV